MLDENLPTFFLKSSTSQVKYDEAFYFTQNGSEPDAQYSLRHLDPLSSAAKNAYAVALFDPHNPDILYGEVLSKPGWSHPTLSQEDIHKNGRVAPLPQPVYPTEFAIQLYNPASHIVVRQHITKWSGAVSWLFSLPQITFRTPSGSDLDRIQSDPGAHISTPQINFAWRKEGRVGKDMTCYMIGKSTDQVNKKTKKTKDPDIVVALFSGLKEVTIMEPNLYRVEIEDFKGLELTLLMSAAVIRDLFFGNPHEQYHMGDAVRKAGRPRKGSSPVQGPGFIPPVMTPQPLPPPAYSNPSQPPAEKFKVQPNQAVRPMVQSPFLPAPNNAAKRSSLPLLTTSYALSLPQMPPHVDARAQWEMGAETARVTARVEEEMREEEKRVEASRKARRKQEAEEERKTRQWLEQEAKLREKEDKERRKRQAAIDKETERLRKRYGDQSNIESSLTSRPSHRYSVPLVQSPWQTQRPSEPTQRPSPGPVQLPSRQHLQPTQPKARKSLWGLRSKSEVKLAKKKSSMF